MAYFDFPFAEVIERWHAMGGETWQLIEPVDGFHPNQVRFASLSSVICLANLRRPLLFSFLFLDLADFELAHHAGDVG